ncbi:MAG: glycosyltransferase family 2 protein [Candidatus Cloacimonetes bacterium]|nr:glycosyltransferase family 2 protein [Candidatus Cloacimonadota bacterium]
MSSEGKVSVVLAAYNGELYLRQQIDSILEQSYQNLELVCVDDCSSDSTGRILINYLEKYPEKVRVSRNYKNLGSKLTFSRGVELATGDFIAFSDQDDVWQRDKIQVLMNELSLNRDVVLVYSNSELVDENLQTIKTSTWDESSDFIQGKDFYKVLNNNTIMGCSLMAKADFVKACLPFPSTGFHHDWYLAMIALGNNFSIKYVDKCLFKYRRHAHNQINKSRSNRQKRNTKKTVIRQLLELNSLDYVNFSNQCLRELINLKIFFLTSLLEKRVYTSLKYWYQLFRRLAELNSVNQKIKSSYFRYIFYSIFWRSS